MFKREGQVLPVLSWCCAVAIAILLFSWAVGGGGCQRTPRTCPEEMAYWGERAEYWGERLDDARVCKKYSAARVSRRRMKIAQRKLYLAREVCGSALR